MAGCGAVLARKGSAAEVLAARDAQRRAEMAAQEAAAREAGRRIFLENQAAAARNRARIHGEVHGEAEPSSQAEPADEAAETLGPGRMAAAEAGASAAEPCQQRVLTSGLGGGCAQSAQLALEL